MGRIPNKVCYRKGEYRDKGTVFGKPSGQSCECLKACGKKYLDPNSRGTELQLKASNNRFNGCQPLEDALLDLGLVRYTTEEVLHKKAIRSQTDEENGGIKDESFKGALRDYLRANQENALDFHHLVERGDVDFKSYRKTTLKRHGINSKERNSLKKQAQHYFLELFFDRFKKNIRAKCTRSLQYEGLLLALTPKQLLVLEKYIIGPLSSETMIVAARELNMNIHTFRDHLAAAKKKIFKTYPDKKARKNSNPYKRDLFYGFWRQSEHEKIHPVKHTIGATGETSEYALIDGNPFKAKGSSEAGIRLNWQSPKSADIWEPRYTFEKWNLEESNRNVKSIKELFD